MKPPTPVPPSDERPLEARTEIVRRLTDSITEVPNFEPDAPRRSVGTQTAIALTDRLMKNPDVWLRVDRPTDTDARAIANALRTRARRLWPSKTVRVLKDDGYLYVGLEAKEAGR